MPNDTTTATLETTTAQGNPEVPKAAARKKATPPAPRKVTKLGKGTGKGGRVTDADLAKVNTSAHESPCSFVHAFVYKNHKLLGRSECIRQLVAKGVAYYTAKTQYQRCHASKYKLGAPAKAKVTKPTVAADTTPTETPANG